MIRSMTGYGRGENESLGRKFTVEIKSVNHRYNDISIKLPRSMNYLEDKIRKTLMKQVFRGKTDVYINFETFSSDDVSVKVNEQLSDAYVDSINMLKNKYDLTSQDTLALVARFPDVITIEKIQEDESVIWDILSPALYLAIESFISMRQTEGLTLKTDILKKSNKILGLISDIEERSPFVIDEFKQKLKTRMAEILDEVEIDEQRLATEVTIYADRGCIDEEITRLKSHFEQLSVILNKEITIGRKLDFLVQEMNREANTIASKSNDIQITNATIELKSEIEKIREQIQNLE